MYIASITNDYDIIPYSNISLSNYTNNENNIDITIPALLFTLLYGLSFLYLMSLWYIL